MVAIRLRKIISGGQTGVDRGALDAAIDLGIAHGGWCPKGRRAEDGRIPERYQLTETDSTEYHVRTEQNVLASDGTLVLCLGEPTGGTALTRELAEKHRKPCLVMDLERKQGPYEVRNWMADNGIAILNVAGPRESAHTGIQIRATKFLKKVLL